MKIGELFIALGFKVQGSAALDDAERGLQRAAVKASALAIAVNGINYAFLRMVDGARAAAVEMKNFAGATGLSAEELKRWQAAGAINDVNEREVAQTITAVQRGIANIRLGQGNIKPFQMLGVQPEDDTFAAIDKMAASLRQLRPEIAAVIAADAGISDPMFQWMRRADFAARELEQRYIMTKDEQGALIELNREWQKLVFGIKSVRDKFAADFTPVLITATKVLRVITDLLAKFVDWLGKGSTGARIARAALQTLLVVMLALGAALAAFAGLLTLTTAAMAALSLAAMPITVALASIAALVAVVVAAFVGLILILQDFTTAATGGKSVFDWSDGLLLTIKNVERLATAIEKLIALKGLLSSTADRTNFGLGAQLLLNPFEFVGRLGLAAMRNASTVTQTNNVKVMVDGAQNPEQTAKAVATEVEQAAYAMPLPNY